MGQNVTHEDQESRGRAVRTATGTLRSAPQPQASSAYPYPPNVPVMAQAQAPSAAGVDIEMMKKAFRTWSQGSSLNKTKFNNALGLLEEVGFKSLRDTPLGNRLFEVFDSSKDGSISEDEFISGMSAILREDANNKRLEYTFKAYDEGNAGFISWNSLCYMVESSWIAAFRSLAVRAKDKNYLTSFQFETWSQGQLGRLKSMLYAEFQQLDSSGLGRLDKPSFYRWAAQDHTIVAEVGQFRVEVPVSLQHIAAQKVEYPAI